MGCSVDEYLPVVESLRSKTRSGRRGILSGVETRVLAACRDLAWRPPPAGGVTPARIFTKGLGFSLRCLFYTIYYQYNKKTY